MSSRYRSVRRLTCMAAMLAVVLPPGHTNAQTQQASIKTRSAGPANITDLRVLLGDELHFQMFDFESDEDFCLGIGYEHDHDGRRIETRSGNVICNLAGRHRFIVSMRRGGDKYILSVALHDIDNGAGSSGGNVLSIPTTFEGWSSYLAANTLYADQDVTVVRWVFSTGQPQTSSRSEHELRIKVRLDDNPDGEIGMWWRQ